MAAISSTAEVPKRGHYTAWVKNGYGGRSTGTSAVPQIADDFVHRAREVGHLRTSKARPVGMPRSLQNMKTLAEGGKLN